MDYHALLTNVSLGWEPKALQERLLSSALLVGALLLTRYFTIHALRNIQFQNIELQRRRVVQVKNTFFVLIVGGLIAVWANELRSVALGLAAMAVAIVVATREFILCFVGGLLKTSTHLFDVGDRIEIGSYRGDVIDNNFVTTTLQEVGPDASCQQYTGRTVVLPNSYFLSQPTRVEVLSKLFIIHTFKVEIKHTPDWKMHEKALLECTRHHCQSYIEQARSFLALRCKKEGIPLPSAEPRVSIDLSHADSICLYARLPIPSRGKMRIEQDILHDYLLAVEALLATTKKTA